MTTKTSLTVSYSVEGYAGENIPAEGIDSFDVRYLIESGPRTLTRAEVEARALLIAAAPEMLIALKRIHNGDETHSGEACERFSQFNNGEESCWLCALIDSADGK